MTHVLPTDPQPEERDLIVFVHGFGSSADSWDELHGLMAKDSALASVFDFARYDYPTPWFNLRFLRRVPTLREIAGGLANFLEAEWVSKYKEVYLIGHSQGGLVIQRYLVDMLKRNRIEELYRLRLVVLIATPNLGSTLLSRTRRLFSFLPVSPQERTLRVFDTQIADLRATISERFVGARSGVPVEWPIPVQCLYGLEDGVVVEASARGPFEDDTLLRVPGDHFSVIRPKSHDDERYAALREALLEPCGHRSMYEVDLYDVKVSVEPLDQEQQFRFEHAGREIIVETDNVARIERRVKFSRKNRCNDMFILRYGTRRGGFLIPRSSHKNEAPPQETQEYEDYGTSYAFGFRPKKGETYGLRVRVYKGFGSGDRNIHFHLAPSGRRVYFKRIALRLDLSAYKTESWGISEPPKVYYHEVDEGHSQLCSQRKLGTPVAPTAESSEGVWEYEFKHLRSGVIDAVWDVEEV